MWKAFYMWRKSIKIAKYYSAQKKMNSNLFLVNPSLQTALLEIRRKTADFYSLDLLEVAEKEHTQHFFYWLENQVALN